MSNNNDNNGFAGIAAFAAAGIIVIVIFLATIAAFIAAVMSIFCLMAWHRPTELFGHTLTPAEARGFIKRGCAGAVIAPSFAVFASAFLQMPIREEAWPYIVVGGYVIGSLVVGCILAQAELETAKQAQDAATMQALSAPPARPVRTIDVVPTLPSANDASPERPPFRFATWDDEEELRK